MGLQISINGADFRPYHEVRKSPPAVTSNAPATKITPIQRQLDHPDAFSKLLEDYSKKREVLAAYEAQGEGYPESPPVHAVYAKDLMCTDLHTLTDSQSVQQAKEILQKHSFRHLPVVNDKNQLVGMTSDRSFLTSKDHEKISDVMSHDLLVAEPDTLLTEMIRGMLEMKVHSVPIVAEDRRLTGIVTSSDILRSLLKNPNIDLWA